MIVHIGNTGFKNDKDGGYFAGELIDWSGEPKDIYIPVFDKYSDADDSGANQQFKFKFLDKFKPEIDQLLKIALDKSSIKKVLFLTDYQFGPENGKTKIINTISDFWKEHENDGLDLNTLYEMHER